MYAVAGYRRAQHDGVQPAIAYIVRIMFGGCLKAPRGWGLDLHRDTSCATLCVVRDGLLGLLLPTTNERATTSLPPSQPGAWLAGFVRNAPMPICKPRDGR